jgi:hypothetical protein
MSKNAYIFAMLATSWLAATAGRTVCAQETGSKEYELKAVFLYNFVMFVDGQRFQQTPKDREAVDPNEPILIGILGQDPFGQAFEALKGKRLKNRRVVVKRFKGFSAFADEDGQVPARHPQLDAITRCHVLFVCASERRHHNAILEPIRKQSILTVADTPGFLEAGGMINFLIKDKKVRFEINTAAAERAKLQIRAKLLRLARRIIKKDAYDGVDDKEHDAEDE